MPAAFAPSLSWPAFLLVGAGAGLVATLAMDVPMRLVLPEGFTPPYVAAGALTDTPTQHAPRSVALAVHYGSGTGAGVIFVVLAGLAATVVPAEPSLAGLPVLAVFAAVAVQLPVMLAFFSGFVLPRYGTVVPERVEEIQRDWGISAAVYVAALAAVVLAVTTAL